MEWVLKYRDSRVRRCCFGAFFCCWCARVILKNLFNCIQIASLGIGHGGEQIF